LAAYTPMMEQYFKVKSEYKHCLVFFRLGDFYEMFFDDALVASKELGITLTGRDCGMDERAPMCGVPYHAANGYIAKLIAKGFNVAICEQTENPKATKNIVKREVIRVITPGTVLDDNVLDSTQNNYIAVVYEDKEGCGLAFADVSTGEFNVTSFRQAKEARLIDELARFRPAEMVVNHGFTQAQTVEATLKIKAARTDEWMFDKSNARELLCKQFNVLNLICFDIEKDEYAIRAAGALMQYLLSTQKNSLSHITSVKPYSRETFMMIDASSRRNLELTETMREKSKKGSLLWAIDQTKTAMGARLLRKWIEQPLLRADQICTRLDAVEEYKNDPLFRAELRTLLKSVSDIERLSSKLVYATANAQDLNALKGSFAKLPDVRQALKVCRSRMNAYLHEEMDVLDDLRQLIADAIADEPPSTLREGGLLRGGYDAELDVYREARERGGDWLLALEEREREATGIKNLRVKYNKLFGHCFEVTNSYRALVPERYIRRQTLSNMERYTTEELKEIETTILTAEEKIAELEYTLFVALREQLAAQITRIQGAANAIAAIDALQSFGEAADQNGYVKPVITEDGVIRITAGRHPVIERMTDTPFVPNDTYMDQQDNRMAIITGPNMAGKSTYMRQVALIVIMAQAGCFVPAENASIGVADRVFTRVGASDDLATGQSTFMVEMSEVANILHNATRNSLLILDEIGRGTSTFDGLSIAWAVLEHIANPENIGAKTLFATHYHELTELETKVDGVVNYCVTVKEQGDNVVFLRRIARGGADRSYGLHVAQLAGIPMKVVSRSRDILHALNSEGGGIALGIDRPSTRDAFRRLYDGE